MPIRFRCGYCSRLLAIARRKAGTTTTCPHCGAIIGVPPPEEFEHRQAPRQELADIDRLLKADQAANGAPTSNSQATAATLAADGFSTTPSSASGTPTPPPSVLTTPGPAAPTRDPVIPTRRPVQIDHEKPLFERDVEDVLGSRGSGRELEQRNNLARPGTSGMDVMSLDGAEKEYVLSSRMMGALIVGCAVLVVLAFVAGYFVGSG